jgi:protocatechuate 3,4-dioxygenase beta subunit
VNMAMHAAEGRVFGMRTLQSLIVGQPARDCFSVRTAADGRFRIANFPAAYQADLGVRKAGKTLGVRASFGGTLPYASGQQDIKLTLEAAGNIEGKVTAEGTGRAMAGVTLRVNASGGGFSGTDLRETVLSGADGSFRLTDLPTGRLSVAATFPGEPMAEWVAENVAVTVTAGETTKDVKVLATKGGVAAITVLSRNGRKPLAGASVSAYSHAAQSSASAVTGADGVARLRLPADDWSIAAAKEGMNSGQAEVVVGVVPGQTNRAEIELDAGLKITGTVRDSGGAAVAGALITISPSFGNGREAKTDANGRYEIGWQMMNFGGNQSYSIIARSVERKLAVSHDIDETTTNVDLKLQEGLTLAVKVQDVNGKPLPTATESLAIWAGNMSMSFNQLPAWADDQGVIEIKALPQGRRYYATVTAKGYGSANPQAQAGDTQSTRFEFPTAVLKVADRKLAGQVLGADSKPVAGASVNVQGPGQPFSQTTTDAKGHFAFNHVCEGQVRVFAYNQNNINGGMMPQGDVRAQGGDTDVTVKLGMPNNQGIAAGPMQPQAPPRATPPKEQFWTWTAMRNWPQRHKVAVIVLLCVQLTAVLGAAGSILWMTRERQEKL